MTFSGKHLHGNVINTIGESAFLENSCKNARYLEQACISLPVAADSHPAAPIKIATTDS